MTTNIEVRLSHTTPNGINIYTDVNGNFYVDNNGIFVGCDKYGRITAPPPQQQTVGADGFDSNGIKPISFDNYGNPNIWIDRQGQRYILNGNKQLVPYGQHNNTQTADGYSGGTYTQPVASPYDTAQPVQDTGVTVMSYNGDSGVDTSDLFIDGPVVVADTPKSVESAVTKPKKVVYKHSKCKASLIPLYDDSLQTITVDYFEQTKELKFNIKNKG